MNTYRAVKDGSPKLLSRSKPPPPPTTTSSVSFLSAAGEEPAVPSKSLPHLDDTSHRYQLGQPPPLQSQQQFDQRYESHLHQQQQQQQQQHQHPPPFRHNPGMTPSRSTSSYLSSFSLPSSDSVGFDDFLSDHGQHVAFRQGYDGGFSFSQDETPYSSSWSSYPSFASPHEFSQLSPSVHRSSSLSNASYRFPSSFSSSHSLSLGNSSSSATLASVASTAASSLMDPPHHAENAQKNSGKQLAQEDGDHEDDSMTESEDDVKEHEQARDEPGLRSRHIQSHSSDYAIQNRSHHQQPPQQPQTHPHSQQPQRQPPTPQQQETYSASFMSESDFLQLIDDYLLSLSPKKREKALLSNAMYQKILMVLLQPKNTQVSTAQFRFWAKKMFTLSTTPTHHIVCHGGKPVATKECLYDVLVYCHRKSAHGGRDKTSAEVRQHYSWVPKELIARFVKSCPLCSSRRLSLARVPSSVSTAGTPMMASSSAPVGEIEPSDIGKEDHTMETDEGMAIQAHYSQQAQLQSGAPWGPLPSVAVAPFSSLEMEAPTNRDRPPAVSDSNWPPKSRDSSNVAPQGQHSFKTLKAEREGATTLGMPDKPAEQHHPLDPPLNLSSPLEAPWSLSQGQVSIHSGGQLSQRMRSQFAEQDVSGTDLESSRNEGHDQTSDDGHEADVEGAPGDDQPEVSESDFPSKEKPQDVIERVAGAYFGHHHDTQDSSARHQFLHLSRYHADMHAHQQNPGFLHHQSSSVRVHPPVHGQSSGELIQHGRQLVANRHLQILGYPAAVAASEPSPHSGPTAAMFGHPLSRLANRGLHPPSLAVGHTNPAEMTRIAYHPHQGRPPHPQQSQTQGEDQPLTRASVQGYEARSSYVQRTLAPSQTVFTGSASEYGGELPGVPSVHPHNQVQVSQQQQQHFSAAHSHQYPLSSSQSMQQSIGSQQQGSRHTPAQHPADQLWSQGRYFQYHHHHRSSSDSVAQHLHASPPFSRLFPTDGAYESYNRYRSSATFSEDMDERTSLSGNDSLIFSASSSNLFTQDDNITRGVESSGLSQGKSLQRRSASASQQFLQPDAQKGTTEGGEIGSCSIGAANNEEHYHDDGMAIDSDERTKDRSSVLRTVSQPSPFSAQSTAPLPLPQIAPSGRHSFPGYYQRPSLYQLNHPLSLQSTSQLFQQVPSYLYPASHARDGLIQRPPSQPTLSSSSEHFDLDLPPLQRSASQSLALGIYDGSSTLDDALSPSSENTRRASEPLKTQDAVVRHGQEVKQGQYGDQTLHHDEDQIMTDASELHLSTTAQPTAGGSGEGQGSSGRRLSVSVNVDSESPEGGAVKTDDASGQDSRDRALCKSSSLAHLLH